MTYRMLDGTNIAESFFGEIGKALASNGGYSDIVWHILLMGKIGRLNERARVKLNTDAASPPPPSLGHYDLALARRRNALRQAGGLPLAHPSLPPLEPRTDIEYGAVYFYSAAQLTLPADLAKVEENRRRMVAQLAQGAPSSSSAAIGTLGSASSSSAVTWAASTAATSAAAASAATASAASAPAAPAAGAPAAGAIAAGSAARPPRSVCQGMHAQLTKGLKTLDIKKISRRDAVVPAEDQMVTNMRTGKTTFSQQSSKNVTDVPDFLLRIQTMMRGYVYVSTMHVAPVETWGGRPDFGVVRNVRYQIARADADAYVEFWELFAPKFKDRIALLISQEQSVRATWISPHGTGRFSLASCVRQSVTDMRASITLAAVPVRSAGKAPGRTGAGTGKQGDGKKPFDIKTLPGFKAGIRTFKGVHEGDGKKVEFCKFFNDGRGCFKAAACPLHHKCDVCKPDGTPCFEDHPRKEHP